MQKFPVLLNSSHTLGLSTLVVVICSISFSFYVAAFAASLDLHLVGPYDVLAGKKDRKNGKRKPNYLRHWRYYYDPPEMLTIVKGDDQSQFHLGYYR